MLVKNEKYVWNRLNLANVNNKNFEKKFVALTITLLISRYNFKQFNYVFYKL